MIRPRPFLALLLSGGAYLAGCGAPQDATEAQPDTQVAEAPAAAAATIETETAEETDASADTEMTVNALAGSFRDAGPDAPAVLIVPGSGPTDRNGDNPMGVRAQPYRLLADELEALGVSSLRVDKRGMFGSRLAGDPNAVTLDLYARDYQEWAARLRERTGRDCVHLLGHSEGGLVVSAAAARNTDGICGLVLIAAPGRPLADVMREQLRANPANAPILADAEATLDTLQAGERADVSGLHPALQGIFAPAVQDFLISTLSVDPAALLRTAGLPTLILQGDRDLQISVEEAETLAAVDGTTLVVLPGANHVLKAAPEDRAGNFATYADPDLPLADGLAEAVAEFVKG